MFSPRTRAAEISDYLSVGRTTGTCTQSVDFTGTTVSRSGVVLCLNKWNGTTAPVAGDDTADGYAPGSLWVDTTNDRAYICVDATAATAVWRLIDTTGITGYLKADGTVALTADWDAGSYEIRAQTLESDVATGTAPLTITSTTVVTNLNVDLLDGSHAAAFQAADAELTAVAGLASGAGKAIEFTGSGTAALFDLTTAGKALLDDANAGAQLTTLGLSANGASLVTAANYAAMLGLLGAQAADADLTTWSGVTPSADGQSLVAAANYAAMLGLLGAQAADAELGELAAIVDTRGSVIYAGAAGWAGLGPGAAGTVLTSAGAGADPAWGAAGAGDMTKAAYDTGDDAAADKANGLITTTGPTTLVMGAVADGEYLKRVGATCVGATPAGAGDMLAATYDADTDNKINAAAGGTDWDSSGVTGVPYIAAGVWASEAAVDETRGGTAQTTYAAGDLLYGSAADTLSKLAKGTVGDALLQSGTIPVWSVPGWVALTEDTHWNDQPASSSTITMTADLTATIKVGMPVKFTLGGGATNPGTYYAVCTSIAANLLSIAGGCLETDDGDLTALWIGRPERAVQVDFFVGSTYGDGANDLLATDMNTYFKWKLQKAYLVAFECTQSAVDTGAEPKVNVKVNAAAVSTDDGNNGVQLGAAGTWVANSAVGINTANYDINNGEAVEITCTVAGGTGDAQNLTVTCVFVLE